MRLSLLVTTYNWPAALEQVLRSVGRQTLRPLEVLVADDGSGEPTRALVARMAAALPMPLHHVWQPDEGFRAARVRNLALARARGDYLVMLDGDMVLHPRFVEDYARLAGQGEFVQGGRVLLGPAASRRVLAGAPLPGPLSPDIGNRQNLLRLPWLLKACSREQPGLRGTRSCCMGLWREDALRVNGFDERFVGWGREDSEFTQRLLNSGLRRRRMRCGGVAFHLHHEERSREAVGGNDALLEETLRQGRVRCERGIDGHRQE